MEAHHRASTAGQRRKWPLRLALTLALLLIASVVAVHVSPRARQAYDDFRFNVRVARGSSAIPADHPNRIIEETIPDYNNVRRKVWIYRPRVHDSSQLPVLYLLHGLPGESIDAFEAGIAEDMDQWIAGGGRPFEIVCPDGNGNFYNDTEWADSKDGKDRVEDYVINKVIPAVEGAHKRSSNKRAIGGFSMGGYGAANIALNHPQLFSQVVSFDGYFHTDDTDNIFQNNPVLLAANSPDQNVSSAKNISTLLVEDNGGTEPLVTGEAKRFGALLQAAHDSVQVNIEDGNHSWAFVDSQFELCEQFLSSNWPQVRR